MLAKWERMEVREPSQAANWSIMYTEATPGEDGCGDKERC